MCVYLFFIICVQLLNAYYRRALNNPERTHEGSSVTMQDVTNQTVERDTDSVGHYEGLGLQNEQEHVYEKANQRTFTRGSQNIYVNC